MRTPYLNVLLFESLGNISEYILQAINFEHKSKVTVKNFLVSA